MNCFLLLIGELLKAVISVLVHKYALDWDEITVDLQIIVSIYFFICVVHFCVQRIEYILLKMNFTQIAPIELPFFS